MMGSIFQPNCSNTIRWAISTILVTFFAHTTHSKIWQFLGWTPRRERQQKNGLNLNLDCSAPHPAMSETQRISPISLVHRNHHLTLVQWIVRRPQRSLGVAWGFELNCFLIAHWGRSAGFWVTTRPELYRTLENEGMGAVPRRLFPKVSGCRPWAWLMGARRARWIRGLDE
jgi:hypothetical protein